MKGTNTENNKSEMWGSKSSVWGENERRRSCKCGLMDAVLNLGLQIGPLESYKYEKSLGLHSFICTDNSQCEIKTAKSLSFLRNQGN